MSNKKGKFRQWVKLKHWEIIALYLFIYDVIVINASYFASLLLRFDMRYSSIP